MSVTRLLVLGTVRLFQPAHGYLVRRELMSWQADRWANLNPGSVYNALRSMTRDRLLDEHLAADQPPGASARPPRGGGPATRATYEVTPDGETEFLGLVRTALWRPHHFEPSWLAAGLSFCSVLTREEMLQALAARRLAMEADRSMSDHMASSMISMPGKPDHVAEIFRLQQEMIRGEVAWIDGVTERLRGGAYWFAGEPVHDEASGRRRDGLDFAAMGLPEPPQGHLPSSS